MTLNQEYREKCSRVLEYSHTVWGELIYGTKDQLMSLGLGLGVNFPPTRNKSAVCKDPRGYSVTIHLSEYRGVGIYSASIHFPGRERPKDEWVSYADGVQLHKGNFLDEYKGDAQALCMAGLVDQSYLPGQPGMGKVQVTLDSDGVRKTDTNGWKKREVGSKTIKKISRTFFLVSVYVSPEMSEVRREAYFQRDDEWRQRMCSLPRPKSLTTIPTEDINSLRMHYAKKDKKFQSMLISLSTFDPNDQAL